MRRLLFLLSFITPFLIQAQEVTGVWQGHFGPDYMARGSSIANDRYRFEVQLAQDGKNINAITYSYLSTSFYGKAAAAGTINIQTGKVLLQEGKLLEIRNPLGGTCIMTCFLQYTKSGDDEFLEGKYVSMNISDSSNCGRGRIFLHKVESSYFYEEPFLIERKNELKKEALAKPTLPHKAPSPPAIHRPDSSAVAVNHVKPGIRQSSAPNAKLPAPEKNTPALARAATSHTTVKQPSGDSTTSMNIKFPSITPRVLLERSNPLVRSLVVNTKEVVLNIYDDGAIDNDTVSVFMDNRLILSHAMLTDKPIVLTLHLDESNGYHELVMVADNEGDIPPNTSLMIVKAGDKEYKVNITSTLQKNAKITFKYVKP
jgi:hypothetical protein